MAVAVERNHDQEATERLARAVRPFLLRRKKTDPDIAPDLPERTVTDLAVPLTTEQVSLYEAEVREALDAIATKSGIERQGLVLRLMTVLKQICNHPAQYLHQAGPVPGRSGKLAALDELLEVIVGAGELGARVQPVRRDVLADRGPPGHSPGTYSLPPRWGPGPET